MTSEWKISGEVVLSCNCDVFCPCVISLGRSKPTEGVCHTWWALDIREGHSGDEKLDGLKAAALMDVPGPMADGNWTYGLYIDERASPAAVEALTEILSGRAGGPISWFSIMISEFLGTKQVPISVEPEGRGWKVEIPKIIDSAIEPFQGPVGDGPTKVANTAYWMASEVTVCTGKRSRFRDWGRNWNLTNRSAEHAQVEWQGP